MNVDEAEAKVISKLSKQQVLYNSQTNYSSQKKVKGVVINQFNSKFKDILDRVGQEVFQK